MANEMTWKEQLAKRTRIFSIAYGLVWLIDAILKWTPAFLFNFSSYLAGQVKKAPSFMLPWEKFWLHVTQIAPVPFAVIIALVETAIALSLIFGVARKPMLVVGFFLNFAIWITAEGFIGRLWTPGETDIGTSPMYCFIFAALWGLEEFTAKSNYWTLDDKISAVWPAWSKISSWKKAA